METPRGQYPKVFGLVAIVCQFVPGLLWICVDGYAAIGSSRPFASNFNPDKSRIPPTPCASTRTSRGLFTGDYVVWVRRIENAQ
jgi:hypothetical protein